MKKRWSIITLMLALALFLAACGGGGTAVEDTASDADTTEQTEATEGESSEGDGEETESAEATGETVVLDTEVVNEGEPIEGGTLRVALVTDTPFQGIFDWQHYEDGNDANLLGFSDESLFGSDAQFIIDDTGIASLDVDPETDTATVTIQQETFWSDGEPLTAEDIVFAYEVIGHPDYTGVRYDDSMMNIVGIEEYKSGEADTISGIEIVDDNTVRIQFKEVNISMLSAGGGVWGYAAPKHHLEDVEVADMAASPEVRENPVGLGAFRVSNIVPGESVTYEANEYYWQGEPILDGVVVEVVNPSNIVAALQAGQYDLVLSMPTDQYPQYAEMPGYSILGQDELAYTYIGFKQGTWDEEAEQVAYDPNAKMSNKSLRQAMAYAIDNDAVGAQFYNGLRRRANSPIVPVFGEYYNEDVVGYPYDPDKANQLLDEAGYVDVDGDGFREDPEGNELVINFASMSGGEVAEPIAEYYMQSWEQVGLNVQLTDGRLIEFNSFYDRVGADDPEIDIYQAAWGVGSDPTPTGLYGRSAQFNYPRWASEENDQYLADMVSEEAWDLEYRYQVFNEWQEYFMEEVPVIPTLYRQAVEPVNNRVKEFNIAYDQPDDAPGYSNLHLVQLTAEEPVTE